VGRFWGGKGGLPRKNLEGGPKRNRVFSFFSFKTKVRKRSVVSSGEGRKKKKAQKVQDVKKFV